MQVDYVQTTVVLMRRGNHCNKDWRPAADGSWVEIMGGRREISMMMSGVTMATGEK